MAWLSNIILFLPYLVASIACVPLALIYDKLASSTPRTPADVVFGGFIYCSLTYTSWALLSWTSYLFLDDLGWQAWDDRPYTAFMIFLLTTVFFAIICLVIGVNLPDLPPNTNNKDVTVEKQIARLLYGIAITLLFFQGITTVFLLSVPAKTQPKSETCTSDWINTNNSTGLHYTFRAHLFGQHMVDEQVQPALYGFWQDSNPQRPLVLSFHGRTGTGKNHVSRLIAESVYKRGLDSEFVHLKIPSRDYPHEKQLDSYKDAIQKEIESSVSQCERQLFIFDEVENLPEGLLDGIKPYIDYNEKVEGADFRKFIFIFLSNVGGREITEILMKHNSSRDTLRISNFEEVIQKAAFNKKDTGLYRSPLMDSHLISHYIPFLPLERQHVELCIKEEVIKMGLPPVSEETVAKITKELQFWPEDTKKYAVKGCKNVREKVNLFAYIQHSPKHEL